MVAAKTLSPRDDEAAAPCILVVDSDVSFAGVFARMCERSARSVCASTCAAATAIIDSGKSFAGFALDLNLRDGSGLRLLSMIATRYPQAAIVALATVQTPAEINYAAAVGAAYLCKPFQAPALDPFLEKVVAIGTRDSGPIASEVALVAHRSNLTPREQEVLLFIAEGGERDTFMRTRAITEPTMKTHVRHILAKCGAVRLEELVADVLRAAARSKHLLSVDSPAGLRADLRDAAALESDIALRAIVPKDDGATG